ncbi:MAG: hypothetical protein M3N95_16655 [Actinomycetota bacterium]|nr:hypothetical protein [Actinomycetota bacterium]
MRSEADLRSVCDELAAEAHSAEDVLQRLDHRPGQRDTAQRAPLRRRLVPLGAAAAVIAVVALIVVLIQPGTSQHGLRPSSGRQITCAPNSGLTPSASQLNADRQTITDRLTRLGVHGGTVEINTAKELVITAPDTAPRQSTGLCADHPLEARPLVAPAVQVSATVAASSNPLSGLPFKPPTSESAYQRLSRTQQDLITAALEHTACTSPGTSTLHADRIICDTTSSPAIALLLGPAILDGTQVQNASPAPPDVSANRTEWTVAIKLNPAGQAAWSTYTAAHSTAGTTGNASSFTACGPTQTPCADLVTFVFDGSLVSTPLNLDPMNGTTTYITGNLNQDTATTLASQIASGQLAVPLHTVSSPLPNGSTSPTSTHR